MTLTEICLVTSDSFFDPMDCISSVHGISWARILEWASPGDLPDLGIEPTVSALAGIFLTTEPN